MLDVETQQSFANIPAAGAEQRRFAEGCRAKAKEADQNATLLDALGPAAADFLGGPDRDTPGAFFALGEGWVPRHERDGSMRFLKGYGGDEWSDYPTVSVWQNLQDVSYLGDDAGRATGSLVVQLEKYPSWTTVGGTGAELETASPAEIAELIARMSEAERSNATSLRRQAEVADARADAVDWRRLNPGPVDLLSKSASSQAQDRVRRMAKALLEAAENQSLPEFKTRTNEIFIEWCSDQIRTSPSTARKALTDAGIIIPGKQGQTGHSFSERILALLRVLGNEPGEFGTRVKNVENTVLGHYG